jgi:hypothetical protein
MMLIENCLLGGRCARSAGLHREQSLDVPAHRHQIPLAFDVFGRVGILDWFHVSMRLRSIEQMAPKVATVLGEQDPDAAALTLQKVPRIRYQMWNGRWLQAVKRMHTIYDAAKRSPETVTPGDRERLQRFRQHLFDLHEYLKNNWKSLTNYAYAYRHGLRISSAPAESGMAHLVIQRMERSNPCAGPRRGLTSCFRSGALSSTVNWQISFVSGFLDFAKIRVRSSVLCDRCPQVCSGSLR